MTYGEERVYSQAERSGILDRCVRPIFLAAKGHEILAPSQSLIRFPSEIFIDAFGTALAE
jgi:hypothetical protein